MHVVQYRRTLSGKRVPADQPRPTWHDFVHAAPKPAPVVEVPVVVEETARDRKNRLARERRAAAKLAASAA